MKPEPNLPDVRVREAAPEGDLLAALLRLSALWEAENNCRGYRVNTPDDLDGRRVWIAEENGKPIGYLFGIFENSGEKGTSVIPAGTECFEVEELYVIPSRRSRGVGTRLFRTAQESVRERAEYLTLSTATKDHRAILRFYLEELGMEFWSARLFKKL